MLDEAQRILDFLPISRNEIENDYIDHLWGALRAIEGAEKGVRGFGMLPVHLLFLLAIQCKILRVAQEQKERYLLSVTLKNPKDGQEEMLAPTSPFALAYFGESELADLCKVVGMPKEEVGKIKRLVRYRNESLAHASGYMELNPEGKITEYLKALEELHKRMYSLNEEVARIWLSELMPEDSQNLREFVEVRLPSSYLCAADFESGLLKERFSNLVDQ